MPAPRAPRVKKSKVGCPLDVDAIARSMIAAFGHQEAESKAIDLALSQKTVWWLEVVATIKTAAPEIAPEAVDGPDLGLDVLAVNGYPVPRGWPEAGPASREAGKVWMFSYGSNSPRQLAERLGHEVKCVPGTAVNRQRVYVGHSTGWKGAVATLVAGGGVYADGGACLVSEADLKILDKYEGVPTKYRRQTIEVRLHPVSRRGAGPADRAKARTVSAVAYLAAPGNQELGIPSLAYLEAVLENMRAHGFKYGYQGVPDTIRNLELYGFDQKGTQKIAYPSGVVPYPHEGENNVEIWFKKSPAAQRDELARDVAYEARLAGSKKPATTPATIAEKEEHLKRIFGEKRFEKYRATFASYKRGEP